MASSGALNLKTKLESLVRLNVPVAAGEDILEAEWFTRNASGEAVQTTGAVNIAYVTFAGTDRPDSRNTQDDPIEGLGTPVDISTGGVTGIQGDYRADVDNVGYDDGESYSQDDALMTGTDGRLTPQTASNPTKAFVEIPIGSDNRLHYTTA
jgi:hypothetical protein